MTSRSGRPPDPETSTDALRVYQLIHASTDGMNRLELAGLLRMSPERTYRLLCRLRAQGKVVTPPANRGDGRWRASPPPG